MQAKPDISMRPSGAHHLLTTAQDDGHRRHGRARYLARSWRLAMALGGALAAALPTAAHANLAHGQQISLFADGGRKNEAPQSYSQTDVNNPVGSMVHSSNVGSLANDARVADASANARIGSIGAYASTAWSISGNLPRDSINAYATAEASWFDTVTINAPGHNGQSGLWSGVLNLTGSGDFYVQNADANWPAYAFNDIDVKAPGLQPVSTTCDEGPPKFKIGEACFRQIGPPRQTMSLTFVMPIVFGQPQNFYATLRADALSAGLDCHGCTTFASVAFNHTLNWGGTTEVRDANGQVLGSYTMSSDSGMDYRVAAVPEPASWLMLLLGLALTLPLARRRRG